ncbi:hypothetical protein [Nocardioides sp. AE5]|uniref:hypothetical protein n=1 Tax=Nocardioides sp. AE5 TaxID=2962573 RepID=UPI002882B3CE|nr:hypothetical protein [Nocardioides sp. AE5]MDT0202503.1 hypothetical protein [Nocardioides sp. AE5]
MTMRRVLVLLMLGLPMVALGSSPAYACDEPVLPFNRQVSHAVHIFTGTVTEQRVDPAQDGNRRIYDVQVTDELKGSGLDPLVRVASSTDPEQCGIGEIQTGDELIFFVGEVQGANYFEAVSTEGTRAASPMVLAQVQEELAPEPEPEPLDVELTSVEDGAPPSITKAIAPGLIVAMVGVVALVIGTLFGRSRKGA